MFGEILTPEQVMERIDGVTSADIQALAQEIFRPDLLSLAVVGPYDSDERFRALLKL